MWKVLLAFELNWAASEGDINTIACWQMLFFQKNKNSFPFAASPHADNLFCPSSGYFTFCVIIFMRQVKIIFLLCSKELNPLFWLDREKAGLSGNGKKPEVSRPSTNPQGEIMHLFGKKNSLYLWGKRFSIYKGWLFSSIAGITNCIPEMLGFSYVGQSGLWDGGCRFKGDGW